MWFWHFSSIPQAGDAAVRRQSPNVNSPSHTARTTQVNERSGGRFKPLVKLMK